MEHSFTQTIADVLQRHFGDEAEDVFKQSELIQYINHKTRSASRGSKSRSSFANLYAIYIIIEDYIAKGYLTNDGYQDYSGAEYSKLFKRQRELPFGAKLQNHALNNRMNAEFQKFFPTSELVPILRDLETNKYWINENLLRLSIKDRIINIAEAIIEIIDEYIKAKRDAFETFVESCLAIQEIGKSTPRESEGFIMAQLAPNVDARLFEIVSYSILKYYYDDQSIFWGYEIEKLSKENLKLYKTGRTNANDGGIDFVMKPLGRFFQVTETLDFKKYFLDIDKIQRYPITFVIKSVDKLDSIQSAIRTNAHKTYAIKAIIERYMDCIEEIINIPTLQERFRIAVSKGYLGQILEEIIIQSKVEFNFADDDHENDDAEDLIEKVEEILDEENETIH